MRRNGGRFSCWEAECCRIVDGTEDELPGLKPIIPTPGGGMTVERVAKLTAFFGDNVALLFGGDFHRGTGGIAANARTLRRAVEGTQAAT